MGVFARRSTHGREWERWKEEEEVAEWKKQCRVCECVFVFSFSGLFSRLLSVLALLS